MFIQIEETRLGPVLVSMKHITRIKDFSEPSGLWDSFRLYTSDGEPVNFNDRNVYDYIVGTLGVQGP